MTTIIGWNIGTVMAAATTIAAFLLWISGNWLISVMISILLLVGLGVSLKIIGPQDMGLEIVLGKVGAFINSGPVLLPPLVTKPKLWPKKVYHFKLPTFEVITKTGTVGSAKKQEDYGAQVIKLTVAFWFNWPNTREGLINTLEAIKISPDNEEELKDHFGDKVSGAFRTVAGGMTWREVTEGGKTFKDKVEDVLRGDDSPFTKAGIQKDDIHVAITEIKLPQKLEDALVLRDTAKIESEAATHLAEATATKTIDTVIRGYSKAVGRSLQWVRKKIRDDEKERMKFLEWARDFVIREQAIKGKSFLELRVEGAQGGEKTLLNLLGTWLLGMQKGGMGGSSTEDKPKSKQRKIKTRIGGKEVEVPDYSQ